MKTVLIVIAKEIFRDEEYLEPKIVLEDAFIRIKTASTEGGPCVGKSGTYAVADMAIADADPAEYEALIFIGGSGASVFFDDAGAHRVAQQMHADGKVVAAICIAPSILARAGLLKGKKATAFESQKEDLIAHGAEFTGAPVEVDGRIVTADGPDSATAFGEAIRDLLKEEG